MTRWSDFKVLLALARAGSVAGAARELQVDSSTISRRLVALEEAVGAQLLIRGGREFNWTAEGRTLVAAGETMEGAATRALRSVRTAKAEVSGTVRVSVAARLHSGAGAAPAACAARGAPLFASSSTAASSASTWRAATPTSRCAWRAPTSPA